MEKKHGGIEVQAAEETYKGVYANNAVIMHTQNEFVVDFMSLLPPKGVLGARVVMTPQAMKRVQNALTQNIAVYEQKFGEIETAEPPTPQSFTTH